MDDNSLSSQEEDLFRNDEDQISDLDGSDETEGMGFLSAMAVNPSVQWARNNILDSGNVKSDWKAEFQTMAASQDYKNLQFKEALKLHVKTEEYRRTFGFSSLKAYLFLFDIVVQNGGFKKSHLKSYLDYLKSSPSTDEMKNLTKLLEIRLTTVRSQYKNDVSSRKMTILTGNGVVHGQSRNLSKEYCYDQELNLGPVQPFDGQFLQ